MRLDFETPRNPTRALVARFNEVRWTSGNRMHRKTMSVVGNDTLLGPRHDVVTTKLGLSLTCRYCQLDLELLHKRLA